MMRASRARPLVLLFVRRSVSPPVGRGTRRPILPHAAAFAAKLLGVVPELRMERQLVAGISGSVVYPVPPDSERTQHLYMRLVLPPLILEPFELLRIARV